MAIGRTFTPDDDRTLGGHPVAMLTYDYWKTRFSGDKSVIGKNIVLNAHNYTIVGVAQQGFECVEFGNTAQVFVPIMMQPQVIPNREPVAYHEPPAVLGERIGRLKSGATATQAEALHPALFRQHAGVWKAKEAAFRNALSRLRGTVFVERYRGVAGFSGAVLSPAPAHDAVMGVDGDHGRRFAHRLRERREACGWRKPLHGRKKFAIRFA